MLYTSLRHISHIVHRAVPCTAHKTLKRLLSSRKRKRPLSLRQQQRLEEKEDAYIRKCIERSHAAVSFERRGHLIENRSVYVSSRQTKEQRMVDCGVVASSNKVIFSEGSYFYSVHGQKTEASFESLATKSFPGQIFTVHNKEDERKALIAAGRPKIIGIDTEQKPSRKTGKEHPLSLIQVATDNAVLIYHVDDSEFSHYHGLIELLCDDSIFKVGHAIKDDLKKITESIGFDRSLVGPCIDTLPLLRSLGCVRPSLKNMCSLYLGFNICKNQQQSDWSAFPLSHAQLLYAATDAWVVRQSFLSFLASEELALSRIQVLGSKGGKRKLTSQELAELLEGANVTRTLHSFQWSSRE